MSQRVVLIALLAVSVGYAASLTLQGVGLSAAHAQSGRLSWDRLSEPAVFQRVIMSIVESNCFVELDGPGQTTGFITC